MTPPPDDESAGSSWTWPSSPGDATPGPPGPQLLPAEARRLGWGMCAAGVVIVVAALLPWKTVGSVHVQGTLGDGILTIVFGFVGAVAGAVRALTRRQGRWPVAGPAIALTLAAFTTLIAYSDVLSVSKIATVGLGLVLTLVGGICLAIFSILALLRRT